MKNKFRSVFLFAVVFSVIFLLLGCPQIKNRCPSLTKVSGPSGNEYHNSCDFSWKGTDSDGHIVRYEIRRDGGIWENVSLATIYTWAGFSEGSHLLEVRAKDDYGDYSKAINWTFSYFREESTGGQTDKNGNVIFESKSLDMDVMVNVNESETNIPVCEMDIFLVNDGSTLIMTAVDKKGRYLPSIATLSLGEQQNQKSSSYCEQSLLGTLVVAGTITLAPLVAQAWGTFIAYGIAENLNAIFRDPPTINNVGLYLHSSGLGVKFSITATPENAWDTLRIGLDLKSFGTLFSGPLSAVFITVAEDYIDSLALDFAHHLVECWGLDWYKQYDIEFIFYPYSTRLGLDVIEVVSVKPTENEPPTVTKISGSEGEINQSSNSFTWAGSDPDGTIVKYEYRMDEGSWVSNGTSKSYTWSGYSEGTHKFEVRAQDDYGQYSNVVTWNFKYSHSLFPYVLTTNFYWETEDLEQAVKNEFGPSATIGDWAELKSEYSGRIMEFINALGIVIGQGNSILVQNNGNRWTGSRHFFITRFDGVVPNWYAVHDQIDDYTLVLGSWYGVQYKVLVKLN